MKWSRYNVLFRSERYGPFIYNTLSNTLIELDEPHHALQFPLPLLLRTRQG